MWGVERHDHSHGHDHGHDPDNPCAHHDHAMVFHSCVCTEILFNGWTTTNAAQLFGSSVVIFIAAVLFEAFKLYREELTLKSDSPSDSQENIAKTKPTSTKKLILNCRHAIQTVMHFLQSTLSYMLMLVFMTYNVWLCLAVVLGLTFGYFLFGWRRSINDKNEHCC